MSEFGGLDTPKVLSEAQGILDMPKSYILSLPHESLEFWHDWADKLDKWGGLVITKVPDYSNSVEGREKRQVVTDVFGNARRNNRLDHEVSLELSREQVDYLLRSHEEIWDPVNTGGSIRASEVLQVKEKRKDLQKAFDEARRKVEPGRIQRLVNKLRPQHP